MNDLTSELRWILLAGGVVLLLVIAIVGRRRRQAADNERHHAMPQSDPQRDRPSRSDYSGSAFEVPSGVPTLEDSLDASLEEIVDVRSSRTEPRIVDMDDYSPLDELPLDDQVLSDEPLPSVHIDEPPSESIDNADTLKAASAPAPTSTPPRKPLTSRKVIALRLVAGAQRFDGAQLKALFASEHLQHGKFNIYHRLDEQGLALFSVASMVEPGTFDPYAMSDKQFPGVTLFMQLPGPHDGAAMFDHMLGCAHNLAALLNGVLQDERGVLLTPQRAARIREDIADLQHLLSTPQLTSANDVTLAP